MNFDLEQKLWLAGQMDQIYEQKTWSNIVDSLLEDFKCFIGQNFERDREVSLDLKYSLSPSFVIWIWRNEEEASRSNSIRSKDNYKNSQPISTVWTGVMAGGMVGNIEGGDIFSVSLTMFIFDPVSKERVCLETGESTMEFFYKKSSDGHGSWVNLGWQKDVYGEWEDIEYE